MLQRSLLLLCLGAASTPPFSGYPGSSKGRSNSSGGGGGAGASSSPVSPSLLVMEPQAHHHAFFIPWPMATSKSSASAGAGAASPGERPGEEYFTVPRSPFSVMRAKRTGVGRCAANLLPQQAEPRAGVTAAGAQSCCGGGGGLPWCCCAALVYPDRRSAGAKNMPAPEGPGPVPQVADTDEDRDRDAFVLGLKLSETEVTLRSIVGEAAYAQLVGPAIAASSRAFALCADPSPLFTKQDGAEGAGTDSWTARSLLSADEENRVKWLWEETGDLARCYSRAPTLRALFVMWSLVKAMGNSQASAGAATATMIGNNGPPGNGAAAPAPVPTPTDIEQVYQRMADHHVDLTLCDVATLVSFASAADVYTQDVVVRLMVRLAIPERIASLKSSRGLSRTDLDLVLVLTALCKYAQTMRKSVQEQAAAAAIISAAASSDGSQTGEESHNSGSGAAGAVATGTDKDKTEADIASAHKELTATEETRLLSLVRVATKLSSLRTALGSEGLSSSAGANAKDVKMNGTPFATTSATAAAAGSATAKVSGERHHSWPHREVILTLIDTFIADTRDVASVCVLPNSSVHMNEFAAWLLREMPSSPACYRHYQVVIDHSPMDALVTLEKCGLLGKRDVDLQTVNCVILPLLEQCGNEDFFAMVMRDVIGLLEDRLRRDPHSFTDNDMRLLAELGTKLFAVSSAADGAAMGGAGNFDVAAREQMEELHVMDGSPWALCVSSYRSLKEIVQNLLRDNRKLKRQVQEQMRNISMATGNVLLGASEAAAGVTGQDQPSGGPGGSDGVATARPAAGSTAAGKDEPPGSANPSDGTAGTRSSSGGGEGEGSAAGEGDDRNRHRMMMSPMIRNRFLVFLENLVKELVDDNVAESERPIVVSSELFAFVNKHVPVPNIQDEYRRKIFLLVNVAEDPDTVRQRRRERRRQRRLEEQEQERAAEAGGSGASKRGSRHRRYTRVRKTAATGAVTGRSASTGAGAEGDDEDLDAADDDDDLAGDLHGGAEEIPAELRFLVSSLPLTLSPWASVMILREVLAESAGRNPRYTYVLNAAIDLQLPISTTRSRIATTLNMWRFLNSQSHKLTLKESVVMKQRCVFNLPLSYILSSYWSLLTSLVVACIILLSVVGLDFESQLVANSLFQKFTPWEEVVDVGIAPWNKEAAADLASAYFEQDEIASKHRRSPRRSSDVILSSASYLFLGYDDQLRPMTLIPISSHPALSEDERSAEEFACAAAVLRELSLHAPFPFYLDLERPMSAEYVESRVAERIRRVSFNNTWFLPRMIIRTFPLGRQYTERMLISHTCSQANLTRRRITFLVYVEDGVPITQQFLRGLQGSFLSTSANLVLVVHERSLHKGGTSPHGVEELAATAARHPASAGADSDNEDSTNTALRVLPYCRQLHDIPDGFFKNVAAATHKDKERREKGGGSGGDMDAALKSFSPFAKHFALHIPSSDPHDEDKRRFVGAATDEQRGILSAAVGGTMDVVVGATAATVNIAMMPFRLALRTSSQLFGGGGSRDAAPDEGERGQEMEDDSIGIPFKAPAREKDSRSAPPEEEATEDKKEQHSRVISVPFSLVKEAMEKTTSTGQSAMRWLGGDDGSAEPEDARGTRMTAKHSSAGDKIDLKKEMGLVLDDAEPEQGQGQEQHTTGLWGGVCKRWGALTHKSPEAVPQQPSPPPQRRDPVWWTPPKDSVGSNSSASAAPPPSDRGDVPPLDRSVLPMMTPWERQLWSNATAISMTNSS